MQYVVRFCEDYILVLKRVANNEMTSLEVLTTVCLEVML
jgi:hypothetical protein